MTDFKVPDKCNEALESFEAEKEARPPVCFVCGQGFELHETICYGPSHQRCLYLKSEPLAHISELLNYIKQAVVHMSDIHPTWIPRIRAALARTQREINRLNSCIDDGDMLQQRFRDGDVLYSKEIIPINLQGLASELNNSQQREAKMVIEIRKLRQIIDDYMPVCPTCEEFQHEGGMCSDPFHSDWSYMGFMKNCKATIKYFLKRIEELRQIIHELAVVPACYTWDEESKDFFCRHCGLPLGPGDKLICNNPECAIAKARNIFEVEEPKGDSDDNHQGKS